MPLARDPSPHLKAPDIDFEEYLAQRVAEKAKQRVLSYFGLATLLVSVLVTLVGWEEMKRLLETKYEQLIAERTKEATVNVQKLQSDFEQRIAKLDQRIESEATDQSKFVASIRSRLTVASTADGSVDLSAAIGPIRDEGPEGSTIGFSLAYAMRAEWKRKHGEDLEFSPRSIYVEAKEHDEFPGNNYEGTTLSGGVKALQNVGAALESDWPYSQKAPLRPPARRFRIQRFDGLTTTAQIIDALKGGAVVPAALQVTDDFMHVGSDGHLTVRPGSPILGGHSVTIVGWNDKTTEFKFANEWGERWGANGFGFIRASDLQRMLADAYRLTL